MAALAFYLEPNSSLLFFALMRSVALHFYAVTVLPGMAQIDKKLPPSVLMATLMPATRVSRDAIEQLATSEHLRPSHKKA